MKSGISSVRLCTLSLVLALSACGGGSGGGGTSSANSVGTTSSSLSSENNTSSSSSENSSDIASSAISVSSDDATSSAASSADQTSSASSIASSTQSSATGGGVTSSLASVSSSSVANSIASSSALSSLESSSAASSQVSSASSALSSSIASSNNSSTVSSSVASSSLASSSETSSSAISSSSSSAPADTTPNLFNFVTQHDVTPGAFITSETITISGINTSTPISIVGGEYSIDDAVFTDADGNVTDGQRVRVRVLAASVGLTTTHATLTIGDISSDFVVTTHADITPDEFVFDAQTDVPFDALIESNSVTISGIDEPVSISITGGEYSIDGAGFTPEEGVIEAGESARLRMRSASTFGRTTTATLVVGDTSADFKVTTIKDTLAPRALVRFPFPVSMTSSNTLLVRGEAQDEEDTPITSVTVDGVAATSNDGFATWQAQVPLSLGKTILKVSTQDADGNVDANAASFAVTTGVVMEDFQQARGIEFDAENNRALVVDQTAKLLVSVDFETRGRIILSGDTTGTGPAFSSPTSVALDRTNNRALVTDIGRKEIIAVDLATGNRSTFSTSPGCSFSNVKDKIPLAVAIDATNNRALAIDCSSSGWGVVAIDLTTAERSRLDTGGKRIDNLTSITVDSLNNRALLGDFGQVAIVGGVEVNFPRVIAVDLTSGVRTVLSGKDGSTTIGGGQNVFSNPVSLSMDSANNRVIVVDENIDDKGAVFGVDLTTGFRSVLSGPRTGGGSTGSTASLADAIAVSLNSIDGRALVIKTTSDVIINVSLTNGNRTNIGNQTNSTKFESPRGLALDGQRVLTVDDIRGAMYSVNSSAQTSLVASNAFTSGIVDFGIPLDLALDQNNNRVLVADGSKGVLSVDLSASDFTKNRTLLSGTGAGTGPSLAGTTSIAIDSDENLAYVGTTQTNAKLFAVDMTTGNRTLVSDSTKGTGPTLRSVKAIVVDKDNDRLLAANDESAGDFIFSVDIETGNRTILSGAGTGTGIDFSVPSSMVLDIANNRLLVADQLVHAIIAVDLTTGDRTEFSGANTGSGPALDQPSGIVLVPNDIALIMDAGADQLFALDMLTGERVLIAR